MIQYFNGGITNTTPNGTVAIGELFMAIMRPNKEMKALLERIQHAAAIQDEKLKHDLKKKLPYYVTAAQVARRCYEDIVQFTGFMPVDFDKLTPTDAVALKYELMKHSFVMGAWLSSSKKGVRALVHVPISKSVEEYKKRFFALKDEFSIYSGFDIMLQSPIQAMYYSMDDDILMNSNFSTFTKILDEKLPVTKENYKDDLVLLKDSEKIIYNIIYKKLESITDQGHPILRAAAYTLGGYVGGDYISRSDAVDMIEKLIINNSYLNKKPSVYLKTAIQMIDAGISSPIKFDNI